MKTVSLRITEACAADLPLTDVTNSEIADEIEEYLEQQNGEISSYDAKILRTAADRLRKQS